MSDQDNGQVSTLQRPTTDDKEAWLTYWQKQGQSWRTEPEISPQRQKELTECRDIIPDTQKNIVYFSQGTKLSRSDIGIECIYPFEGMKLSRADVEWLLATHDNGRGPVNWNDERHRKKEGLDLRGADLSHIDLSGLPLTRLRGGVHHMRWHNENEEQSNKAAIHLEGTNLMHAHLEGSILNGAHLEGVGLAGASLEKSELYGVHLEGADLASAHLEGSLLFKAHLEGAFMRSSHLEGTVLSCAHLEGKALVSDGLDGIHNWSGKFLKDLQPAILCAAFLNDEVYLENIILGNERYGSVSVADVRWGDANLALVDWSSVKILGDEREARQQKRQDGIVKGQSERLRDYEEAVRAYRQLAVALQSQGLNEIASRFAYRAQLCQRIVLRRQKKFGQYIFSGFLDLFAGYGYHPERTVLAYLFIIIGFAVAYHFFGGLSLYPPDAFIYSLTSFHGRGFFPGLQNNHSLHDPLVVIAALEAVIGLVIEASFIATFTQRFFGK